MSKQQLAQRMLCSRGQIDAHKLRKGMLQSHEYAHLANVVGELAKAPIWVDDSPGLTPLDLRAKARRLKLQHDIKCIMIDYMQLMDNPGAGEPPAADQRDQPRHQGGRARAERAGHLPVAAQPRQRRPRRPPPAHERPARVRLDRAGRRRDHAPAPRGLLPHERAGLPARTTSPRSSSPSSATGRPGTVKLTFMNKTTRFENLSTQTDPF